MELLIQFGEFLLLTVHVHSHFFRIVGTIFVEILIFYFFSDISGCNWYIIDRVIIEPTFDFGIILFNS